jgi:hypothetical protein
MPRLHRHELVAYRQWFCKGSSPDCARRDLPYRGRGDPKRKAALRWKTVRGDSRVCTRHQAACAGRRHRHSASGPRERQGRSLRHSRHEGTAERIGAKDSLQSTSASGTDITLIVPGRVAFISNLDRNWSRPPPSGVAAAPPETYSTRTPFLVSSSFPVARTLVVVSRGAIVRC